MKLKLMIRLLMLAGLVSGFAPVAQAFYNPSAGRWLSRDPVGEFGGEAISKQPVSDSPNDASSYRFLANDPLTRTDYLGLGPIDIHYCTTQGVMLIGTDGQAI